MVDDFGRSWLVRAERLKCSDSNGFHVPFRNMAVFIRKRRSRQVKEGRQYRVKAWFRDLWRKQCITGSLCLLPAHDIKPIM